MQRAFEWMLQQQMTTARSSALLAEARLSCFAYLSYLRAANTAAAAAAAESLSLTSAPGAGRSLEPWRRLPRSGRSSLSPNISRPYRELTGPLFMQSRRTP